jgi:hypothetical protein
LLATTEAKTTPSAGGLSIAPSSPSLLASCAETPRCCAIDWEIKNVNALKGMLLSPLSLEKRPGHLFG